MEPADLNAGLPEAQPIPAAVPVPDLLAHTPIPGFEIEILPENPDPPVDEVCTVKFLIAPTASRRLTECLVIFIGAILFLRAMAVEPFGVPTGSMAPTLSGNHRVAVCPRCNYTIRIGEPSHQNRYPTIACPNCGQPDIDVNEAPDVAGDRLLVDKNVYSARKPRRWEPAVFRCPSDLTKPYVKRVIGLPGERIQVIDGDVYADGRIVRKTLAECREARVPVFDLNFPPREVGWSRSWVLEGNVAEKGDAKIEPSFALVDKELHLDGTQAGKTPVWIGYRHQRYDESTAIDKDEIIRDRFVYNGPSGDDRSVPVHDFIVEFEVEIVGGSGFFFCRMSDGKDQLVAASPSGDSKEEAQLRHEGLGIVRSIQRKPLEHGKKYRIEMAFVDRRLSCEVDGRQSFIPYDLEPAKTRADLISPLSIGVQGIKVVVRNVKLYRDIFYRSSGRNAVDEPLQLGKDEYFMLGDNSANSDDSRSWPIPGVPERNFLGKPFLLHQPSRITHLTINGRERVFQSIDWSRIRFLR